MSQAQENNIESGSKRKDVNEKRFCLDRAALEFAYESVSGLEDPHFFCDFYEQMRPHRKLHDLMVFHYSGYL